MRKYPEGKEAKTVLINEHCNFIKLQKMFNTAHLLNLKIKKIELGIELLSRERAIFGKYEMGKT